MQMQSALTLPTREYVEREPINLRVHQGGFILYITLIIAFEDDLVCIVTNKLL
jgi:hypothetical protein